MKKSVKKIDQNNDWEFDDDCEICRAMRSGVNDEKGLMEAFAKQNMKNQSRKKITKEELENERREIEADINYLLVETESDFTLQDVKDVIYHEEDKDDDFQKILMMFDNGDMQHLSNAIEIATDAWNHFPHKALKGKSPAEML